MSTWNVAGRFFYRIAPEMRLLAEIRDTGYDYHSSPTGQQRAAVPAGSDVGLHRCDHRYCEGRLHHTNVQAGRAQRLFGSDRGGSSAVAAEDLLDGRGGRIVCAVAFCRARASSPSIPRSERDGSIIGRVISLTRVFATYVNSDLQDISRTDRVSRVGIGAYFDIRSWLRLGADFSHENRNSTDSAFDYSRNVVIFSIAGTL